MGDRGKDKGIRGLQSFMQRLPLGAAVTFGAGIVAVAVGAGLEQQRLGEFRRGAAQVTCLAPEGAPPHSQESIDFAMELYSVRTKANYDGPEWDAHLEDRGLTTGSVLGDDKHVTVGAAALSSWGLLGSTLGHEIEVHVAQSFLEVTVRDELSTSWVTVRKALGSLIPSLRPGARELFENDGTWKAEREAYMYELHQGKRFGLTPRELASIHQVMNHYYPARRAEDSFLAGVHSERHL